MSKSNRITFEEVQRRNREWVVNQRVKSIQEKRTRLQRRIRSSLNVCIKLEVDTESIMCFLSKYAKMYETTFTVPMVKKIREKYFVEGENVKVNFEVDADNERDFLTKDVLSMKTVNIPISEIARIFSLLLDAEYFSEEEIEKYSSVEGIISI